VNHLGDLASALVDGELTGSGLDRVNAHLAACATCRAEAAQLRRLKRELSALAAVDGTEALTRRLLAMPGPPDPRLRNARSLPGAHDGRAGRHRGRYAVWGAVSLVVASVGVAAFGMGGTSGTNERQVTPQLERFDLQHAVTSGDLLFDDSRRTPARAAARP
jgi:anti-sigma factor RsiW